MPVYRARVLDAAGRPRRLARQASSEDQALRELVAEGWHTLAIRERPRAAGRPRPLGRRSLLELTEGLAVLLGHGVSLRDALDLLSEGSPRPDLERYLASLRASVDRGESFHAALQDAGRALPRLFGALAAIGDRTGRLDRITAAMARLARERLEIRDKIAGAAAYPALVLALTVVVTVFLALYVGPRLRALPAALGATDAALAGAASAAATLPGGMAAGIAGVGLFLLLCLVPLRRDGPLRRARDGLLLVVPGLGPAVRLFQTRDFVVAMEAMTSAGISVEEALGSAAAALENRAVADAVVRARERVMDGRPLSRALAGQDPLPPELARWAAIGERTGDVPAVFAQLSKAYGYRVEQTLGRLTTLVEPAFIIVAGGIVVWIILTVVVPILGSVAALIP